MRARLIMDEPRVHRKPGRPHTYKIFAARQAEDTNNDQRSYEVSSRSNCKNAKTTACMQAYDHYHTTRRAIAAKKIRRPVDECVSIWGQDKINFSA